MSEIVELSNFEVHNKFSPRMMEKLALKEWIDTSRRSKVPGTTYKPKDYPQIITADKIVNSLENMNHRLKLLEESFAGLGKRLEKLIKKIITRISKFESKQEGLEFKILSYEAAQ